MRLIGRFALPLTILVIVGLVWVLSLSKNERRMADGVDIDIGVSPWDALSGAEIARAAKSVKAKYGDAVLFNRISLKQPDKQPALAWQAGTISVRAAEIAFQTGVEFHLTAVDLQSGEITSDTIMRDGQPMYSGKSELEPLILKFTKLPDVAAALAKRDIGDDEAICMPRTIGRFFADKAEVTRSRLVRSDCFYIASTAGLGILPSTNVWGRPIEGLSFLFDLSNDKIVEVLDSYADKPAPPVKIDRAEFHQGAYPTRQRPLPIELSRPQGRNFTVAGSRINWQGWQFYLRFDPRQGTIINQAGITDDKGFRPVAYEIAMSEMFVPYQDENPHWFYRNYFDMGEYGFGNLSTELKGADCPAHAVFQSVVLHLPNGDPVEAQNRICIFEHDPGHPVWRHHEIIYDGVPGMKPHQSRRATELVVRMVATIGNYDYFQDYVFQQDGQLRIRVISTGIDAVKGVFAKNLEEAEAEGVLANGNLIAPHRVGINHDHFFNYRIDIDVDGPVNNFDRLRLSQKPLVAASPRRSIWTVTQQRITDEKRAQTIMLPEKPALLVFSSADKTNAIGYPSGYQLIMPPVRPLVDFEDPAYQRAYFTNANLWVTRFKPMEIFASGVGVNQSAPWLGLPEYIDDNETLENQDLVAWATLGFHHVPMAEDWPVMPVKIDQIILKPRNFFNHNPAIDLPE